MLGRCIYKDKRGRLSFTTNLRAVIIERVIPQLQLSIVELNLGLEAKMDLKSEELDRNTEVEFSRNLGKTQN